MVLLYVIRKFGRRLAGEYEPHLIGEAGPCKSLHRPELVFVSLAIADA
jgi:hypothetical protein